MHRINVRNSDNNFWLLRITNAYKHDYVEPILDNDKSLIENLCKSLSKNTGVRITIIATDGIVLGESHKANSLENHKYRDEFKIALQGKNGFAMRKSTTLDKELAYCAVPLFYEDRIIAVVRSAIEIENDSSILSHYFLITSVSFLLITLIGFLICLLVFSQTKRRLDEQKNAIDDLRSGNFTPIIEVGNPEELREMAISIKKTAKFVGDKNETLENNAKSQLAILMGMGEGVIAIDCEHNVIAFYKTASKMLGIHPDEAIGKKIHQVVRNSIVISLAERVFKTSQSVEDDFTIERDGKSLSFQANASVVKDQKGSIIGAVIILNDITRLKKLENIRRDFVTNVTHELKTPITSIKGSAETLSDGAFEDEQSKQKFLSIILRQSDRLSAIIDDLLTLSRIEQDEDQASLEIKPTSICQIFQQVKLEMSGKALKKDINLSFDCDENLIATVNGNLLEQAIANLVDNAIKYTNKNGKIDVTADLSGQDLIIRVSDNGIGISNEHIPRLFERFYRIDKARSRKDGGTGLGLAIVKHIAGAHNGKIEVDSTPGVGSIFTIVIPSL
jgi:two-component system phosphate regulon sensor histidine kinase PhoR